MEDDFDFRVKGDAMYETMKDGNPWCSRLRCIRQMGLGVRFYQGDVFQPALYTELCAKLDLMKMRDCYIAKEPEGLYGSAQEEE